jgi:hypothetical protein
VHFKAHASTSEDPTLPDPTASLEPSFAGVSLTSQSQPAKTATLDSKHSQQQPRTATAATATKLDSKSDFKRPVSGGSYLNDSKQTEGNIELLRTALHLFVHNQSTEALSALRAFEQKVGSAGATHVAASSQPSILDECALAVSSRVIDALPFTGKARLENALATTGLPLHDGMYSPELY